MSYAVISPLTNPLTVTGAALSATAATLDLILYYAFPRYAYHSCIASILGKLYSNSLPSTLNARQGFISSSAVRKRSGEQIETNFLWNEGLNDPSSKKISQVHPSGCPNLIL